MFFRRNEIIDQSALGAVVGNDFEFLKTMIPLFSSQSEESLKALSLAIVKSDWEGYLRASHDIKNLARSVASQKLLEQAIFLEKVAAIRDKESALEALDETTKLLQKASKELLGILAKTSRGN